MSAAPKAFRRPPGPATVVELGVNPETLATLLDVCDEFGDIASMNQRNGRLAYFINDPAEVRRILGLLLPRFRMMRVDHEDPGIELAINLRSANDISLEPETRTA